MLQVKCIQKIRDRNNRICQYELQDTDGNIKTVYAHDLKKAIRQGQVYVTNLTLSSDGRLIDSVPDVKEISASTKIQSIFNKAKLLGIKPKMIPTECEHYCYLFSNKNEHIVVIPDNVIRLNDMDGRYFTKHIKDLYGTIRVVGGENLNSIQDMFSNCHFDVIDLKELDTSKVVSASNLFSNCEVETIRLPHNTGNMTDAFKMFHKCKTKSLDLSVLDTSNMKSMQSMFELFKAESINFGKFDTRKTTDMTMMFHCCDVKTLDLTSFNTEKVDRADWMFAECKAEIIDLSSFNMRKTRFMQYMFYNCNSNIITSCQSVKRAVRDNWVVQDGG